MFLLVLPGTFRENKASLVVVVNGWMVELMEVVVNSWVVAGGGCGEQQVELQSEGSWSSTLEFLLRGETSRAKGSLFLLVQSVTAIAEGHLTVALVGYCEASEVYAPDVLAQLFLHLDVAMVATSQPSLPGESDRGSGGCLLESGGVGGLLVMMLSAST